MSRTIPTKMHRLVTDTLRDSGLSWRIDIGKKHRKLYIEGKLALVFSHGAHQQHDLNQIKSIIRRHQCS